MYEIYQQNHENLNNLNPKLVKHDINMLIKTSYSVYCLYCILFGILFTLNTFTSTFTWVLGICAPSSPTVTSHDNDALQVDIQKPSKTQKKKDQCRPKDCVQEWWPCRHWSSQHEQSWRKLTGDASLMLGQIIRFHCLTGMVLLLLLLFFFCTAHIS